MKVDLNVDLTIRLAVFEWLSKQVEVHGNVLPRKLLQAGFPFSDKRIHIIGPQGIFTPKLLEYPLSITTSPNSPYQDVITETDFILYKYRGSNPQHRDNVGLRKAMELRLPLVYFHGIVPGKYMAVWPVYVIADNVGALEFRVAVDETKNITEHKEYVGNLVHDSDHSRKEYITRETRVRLHQRAFREKVLVAYREQCALCKLRHRELLDAAHIIPDSEEHSQTTVNNGISLCKLHHAAFDSRLIGITPDFTVEVKQMILEEEDGPMLQYGLKALHGSSIILPADKTDWPNRDFLSERHQEFNAYI